MRLQHEASTLNRDPRRPRGHAERGMESSPSRKAALVAMLLAVASGIAGVSPYFKKGSSSPNSTAAVPAEIDTQRRHLSEFLGAVAAPQASAPPLVHAENRASAGVSPEIFPDSSDGTLPDGIKDFQARPYNPDTDSLEQVLARNKKSLEAAEERAKSNGQE